MDILIIRENQNEIIEKKRRSIFFGRRYSHNHGFMIDSIIESYELGDYKQIFDEDDEFDFGVFERSRITIFADREGTIPLFYRMENREGWIIKEKTYL